MAKFDAGQSNDAARWHNFGGPPVQQPGDLSPGVGQKVAAPVLNFSTLSRRIFVVDGHVLRVAHRLAICGPDDGADACREAVMEAAPDAWAAEDFTELHVLMKRLGQGVCGFSSPDCRTCALNVLCS